MKLTHLLRAMERRGQHPRRADSSPEIADVEVEGLVSDSRKVSAGDLFVALQGQRTAGARFAEEAASRGAVAVVADTEPAGRIGVAWFVVEDARLSLAVLADTFYGHPSDKLQVVGITGTNGKTTTAYLLRAMFEAAGVRCGLLGTVVYAVGDEELGASRTTPEAPEVQRWLRRMIDKGCGACAMEVSSHALSLKRVDETRFAAGVFTNLTRDHLDYHGNMDSYFAAKRRLFEMLPAGAPAVINLDDPRGEAIAKVATRPVSYAINKAADVAPGPLTVSWEGVEFDARTPRGSVHVHSRLLGRSNVSNILAAVATTTALDLPISAIERGLEELEGVPGRFQVVSRVTDDITVVIDYAHTDDALRNLLETARPIARGRVITLFGCGGDRDRTKRPLMGAVAGKLSDVVVLTSDNPRSEDPARIIEEVKLGLMPLLDRPDATRENGRTAVPSFVIVEREEAIHRAIAMAQPGDLVLLAGKGHEKTQIIGDAELPFDDVEVARGALSRRRTQSSVR